MGMGVEVYDEMSNRFVITGCRSEIRVLGHGGKEGCKLKCG